MTRVPWSELGICALGCEIGFVLHFFGYSSRVKNWGAITFWFNPGISGYWFECSFHFVRPFSLVLLSIHLYIQFDRHYTIIIIRCQGLNL